MVDPAKVAALLVVAIAGSAAAVSCPAGCSCSQHIINCTASGQTQPPLGLWPNNTFLYLSNNNISTLQKYSFTGFPQLTMIILVGNVLKELDMEVFTATPNLNYLDLKYNSIETILPPSPGKKLMYVRTLMLEGNNILSFDPYLLETALPSLNHFSIGGNPAATECNYEDLFWWATFRGIMVVGGNPCGFTQKQACPSECSCNGPQMICASAGLVQLPVGLWTDYEYLILVVNNISVLHEYSFTGFPNVDFMDISANPIPVFEWEAFAALPKLEYLNFAASNIEAIEAPAEGLQLPNLQTLGLSSNNILSLDVSILESALPSLSKLYIDNTPLACECNYKELYFWAQNKGVYLYAWCANIVCLFEE